MLEVLHTVLCLALFWASFCRAARTSRGTRPVIRTAICAQATAAIAAGAAPWLTGYRPEWPALVLLGSMVLVQGATSTLWRAGVPSPFVLTVFARDDATEGDRHA